MKIASYVLLVLLSCFGCKNSDDEKAGEVKSQVKNEISFDKAKWQMKKDKDYIYRKKMIGDLMSNHKLKELKRPEIIELLGEPDRSDGDYLFYLIDQKRIDFLVLSTKTMVIKIAKDSVAEWIRIHE